MQDYQQRKRVTLTPEQLDLEVSVLQRAIEECIQTHRDLGSRVWLPDSVMAQSSHSINLLSRAQKSLGRARKSLSEGELE